MNTALIIGGGAAGFFTAINIKRKCPELRVVILEKTKKVLQKVKVSGGGRCNVTNGRVAPGDLVPFYPRGGKKLYPVFKEFGTKEMRSWLSKCDVPTKVEDDQRVFPESNNSQTIVDGFLGQCRSLGIEIVYQSEVISIDKSDELWKVETSNGNHSCEYLIMTAGASGKCWRMLSAFGFKMNQQVPSLFTFHVNDERLKDLPGVSFLDVSVKVAGTKLVETGPLLITHWGFSGPSILKLSAWGAVELADKSYQFNLIVNFSGLSFDECKKQLEEKRRSNPKRLVKNESFEGIPRRYWEQILTICDIENRTLGDLGKTQINKLCEELTQAHFSVVGKSAFKEEFVTCGGVELSELNLETMECKRFPGLFMAGEVIDIDALTGGFNFQACWSEGWLISEYIKKVQGKDRGA
jgi:predicted Rossmann fold flavoprotein